MKKVLIIPSWYPTEDQPSKGIFFKEQALLASTNYDVRVMVTEVHRVPRRSPFLFIRKLLSSVRTSIRIDTHDMAQPPLYFVDHTIASLGGRDHEMKLRMSVIRAMDAVFSDGWVPDVIHAHCALHGGVYAKIIAEHFSIPFVVTEHQHLLFDYFPGDSWSLARTVYASAVKVAAVSRFQLQMLRMNRVHGPIDVIGNLVDERMFSLGGAHLPEKLARILFVGTKSHLKDHETFFQAMAFLRQATNRELQVSFVCPDLSQDWKRAYLTKVSKLGLDDCVTFLAEAPREAIVAMLHSHHVFVSTSIAETFGVAVCEALMCGCPVVVTKSGGVSDFVVDGKNGFLVEIGDAQAVARALLKVLSGKLEMSPAEIRQSLSSCYGTAAFLEKLDLLYAVT